MNSTWLVHWPSTTRIACAVLVAAIGLDIAAIVHVRRNSDEPGTAPIAIRQAPRTVIDLRDDADVMRAALGKWPFDVSPPTRAVSYAVVQQSQPTPARPRLIGTVQQGRDGGFVMVEKADGQMQLVHIGERTGDLRLRAVSAGVAQFEDGQGNRVSLKAPATGSETRP